MTILEISYPKSGTHALLQILQALVPPDLEPVPPPFFAVFESDGTKRTPQDAVDWLNSLRPNDVAASHLYAWDRVREIASKYPFVTYFIHRDLRDVCVSYVTHVTKIDTSHYHHDAYVSLPNFDARLTASILDVMGSDSNIGLRFKPYLKWLDCPNVLSLRFRDLINDRLVTLERIIRHFEKQAGYLPFIDTPEALATYMRPELSGTFVGLKSKWRKCFKASHKALFKEVTGDLLVRLGYEKSNDW